MALYKEDDIALLRRNWESIMSEVEREKMLHIGPSIEEMKAVHDIVINFVREKGRIIYGGYALNLLVSAKDPKDAIYKDSNQVNDVDFYSPTPIEDLMELCNILHERGFRNIFGAEAQHTETYNVSVNFTVYCDISYVPRIIYGRMPTFTINGLRVIGPHFMAIDYLRMITDPLISYWRFDTDDMKALKRFHLLLKHYGLPQNNKTLIVDDLTPELREVSSTIYEFIENRQTVINIGFLAYNYFLYASGATQNYNSNYQYLPMRYFEMISTDYKHDCQTLKEMIENIPNIDKTKLSYSEFYPYFQFTGYSFHIYYDNNLVACVYDNNKKCLPYHSLKTITNFNNPRKVGTKVILGNFPLTLMYGLINIQRSRTVRDKESMDFYYTFVSHLVSIRDYFFRTYNKTILDDTIFKEFTAKCIGTTIHPKEEKHLLVQKRRKQKRAIVFRYNPEDELLEPSSNEKFLNSSGNEITNPKNLKILRSEEENEEENSNEDEDEINNIEETKESQA